VALIPITGLPSSNRVPGGYAEILFAQGATSSALGAREVVIVMPKTSAGTAVAGSLYSIGNEQDLRTYCGVGSPGHRAGRIFLKANKGARLWYLGMSATTGGTPGAAASTITYAGTASASGSTTVTICGEEISVGIRSGDTAATIGANVIAAINASEHLPVTASGAAGVVITARISGLNQGDGTVPAIRYRAVITAGITTTVAADGVAVGIGGASTAGVEGTTTEATQLATALASLDAVRKYYIVTSTYLAAGLTSLVTHLNAKSLPTPGLRSVGICGFNGALAATQTLSTSRNYERLVLAWQRNSEHDPAELAGNLAAVMQLRQGVDSSFKFDSYRRADWLIKPVFAAADYLTHNDMSDAINSGITAIASDGSGSYIVMLLDTRSKNSAGTVADFRATEQHRISVADEFADQVLANFALNYGEAKLASDVFLSDGKLDPAPDLPPGVITPELLKPFLRNEIDTFVAAGKMQDAAGMKLSLRAVRDPNNSGRVEFALDIRVIDHLHQGTFRIAEVSPG